MKKICTLFVALIFAGSLIAQTPQSFKYQAVARDASGDVVADQAVGLQISILNESTSGSAVYVETFMPTTNEFGLINLNIGTGIVVSGDFTTIDWSADTYFVKIEMDITGGTTYTEYGTSQLLSVPYALHAKTAANTFSGNYSDLTGAPLYVSTFTNDAGYLTSFTETDPLFTTWDKSTGISITESQVNDLQSYLTTETDPVFGASSASGITGNDITNWNEKLDSYTETDPVFSGWDKSAGISITESQISDLQSYLTTEADPVFNVWDKSTGISITEGQISDLDHFTNTDETDPVFGLSVASGITGIDITNWNNKLDSYTETDPIFGAHLASGITSTQISNWETSYSWGDHSLEGYLTSYTESDPKVGENTTNYLSKWDGSALVSSTILDNGNVGIGTITPTDKLHVDGSLRLEVGNYVRVDGTSSYLGLSGGDGWISTGAIIQLFGVSASAEYANSIRFLNNGGEAMRITGPSGNVGIGTTSPSTELDVNGVITAIGGNSNNWNSAYDWGDHSVEGYLTTEVDGDASNEIQSLAEVLSEGNLANGQIKNVTDPTDAQDAATKAYVDVLLEKIEYLESLVGEEEPVTDYDGNEYRAVRIGYQVWMAENLKTTTLNNGTAISLVTGDTEWSNSWSPAYCWYDNDEASYKNPYGALYNWHTIETGNLCPSGWHVPDDSEWTTLTDYLDGVEVAGGKLKSTGTVYWHEPNEGATNQTGFSALPGGRRFLNGTFYDVGLWDYMWSSSENGTPSAWYRGIYYNDSLVRRLSNNWKSGFSVRCLRD